MSAYRVINNASRRCYILNDPQASGEQYLVRSLPDKDSPNSSRGSTVHIIPLSDGLKQYVPGSSFYGPGLVY